MDYPCTVCEESCDDHCIYCEDCNKWSHFRCQNINRSNRKVWQDERMVYTCVKCRTNSKGEYDYIKGLNRLERDTVGGFGYMLIGVMRERQYLKNVTFKTDIHQSHTSINQDKVANAILTYFYSSSKVAIASTGNGDCLFNSFSIHLVGDESRSDELRYRCSLELIENKSRLERHRIASQIQLISPDFDTECFNTCKKGYWCSMWHILAMSHVLNTKIEVIYPAVNGTDTFEFKTLNQTFRPPFLDPDRPVLTIMWSSLSPPTKIEIGETRNSKFVLNHFVPLVVTKDKIQKIDLQYQSLAEPLQSSTPISIDLSHSDVVRQSVRKGGKSTPPGALHTDVSPTAHTSVLLCPSESPMHTPKTTYQPVRKGGKSTPPGALHTDVSPAHTHKIDLEPDQTNFFENLNTLNKNELSIIFEEPNTTVCDNLNKTSCQNSEIESLNSSSFGSDGISSESVAIDSDVFTPGPLGNKFLDINCTVQILRGPYTLLEEIPSGRKDGMFYVVDNSKNIERKNSGQKSEFWDDCGSWSKAASPLFTYVHRDNKLISVLKKNGEYCIDKCIDKKRIYVPLEPAPSHGEFLVIQRLYQTLAASEKGPNQFKRRCTQILTLPDSLPEISINVAIVEYIGLFPDRRPHGSCKTADGPVFIRTKPKVQHLLKEQLKSKNVKSVEHAMNLKTNDDNDKQRNEKQLRNIKYNLNKVEAMSSNAADQIVCVEEMTKSHEFVYSVKHLNGILHPVITLMNQQQITDIKRFCCTGRTVLGVDKTYNLGDFHVTPTVYKDLSVVKRQTGQNPISFGPTFIHTNSSARVYSSFFHEIADNLGLVEISNLVIGSDEEQSFRVSIERCLPGSTHILCTRHLRQNINKYLEDQVGYPIQDRQTVNDAIFGVNGIVSSKDVDTYEYRVNQLSEYIIEKDLTVGDKKFLPYWNDRMLPTLKKFVIDPSNAGKCEKNWTNNNCESANHILKNATNWKNTDLPKFIELLYEIVKGETIEKCRSIRGSGNFQLDKRFMHNLVSIDQWSNMSNETKERREKKFLADKGRDNSNMVISLNGQRSVLKTPTAGKKPNQVKRKRAERSRTPMSKRIMLSE